MNKDAWAGGSQAGKKQTLYCSNVHVLDGTGRDDCQAVTRFELFWCSNVTDLDLLVF